MQAISEIERICDEVAYRRAEEYWNGAMSDDDTPEQFPKTEEFRRLLEQATSKVAGLRYERGVLFNGRRYDEDNVTTVFMGGNNLTFEEDKFGNLECIDSMTPQEAFSACMGMRYEKVGAKDTGR